MNTNVVKVGSVPPGWVRSLHIQDSGVSLNVKGDGKVEPELSDRFTAGEFIGSIDAPRLVGLSEDCQNIWKQQREACLPKDFNPVKGWDKAALNKEHLEAALEKRLGKSWRFINGESTWSGPARAKFEWKEGECAQKIVLDESGGLRYLLTKAQFGAWAVCHVIEANNQGLVSEDAVLRIAPPDLTDYMEWLHDYHW